MKNKKFGFSMVELLFVMAIMAALAAIAIPKLQDSSKAVVLTSMKSDTLAIKDIALNALAQGIALEDLDVPEVIGDSTGKVTIAGLDFPLSEGNVLKMDKIANNDVFRVRVSNDKYDPDKRTEICFSETEGDTITHLMITSGRETCY